MAEQHPGKRNLMSQKEYAAHRGCSKQYVNQLVKQGRIPLVDGRIDPAVADAALSRQRDPARESQLRADSMIAIAEPGIPGGDESERPMPPFAKARTVREHFRALRERLEYEHLVGKLVVAQEVEDAAHEAGLMVRQAFEMSAERIGEAIAAQLQVDRAQAAEIAAAEIRATLKKLHQRLSGNRWQIGKGLSGDQS